MKYTLLLTFLAGISLSSTTNLQCSTSNTDNTIEIENKQERINKKTHKALNKLTAHVERLQESWTEDIKILMITIIGSISLATVFLNAALDYNISRIKYHVDWLYHRS